jgi:N-formylglutamate amidohydrolase
MAGNYAFETKGPQVPLTPVLLSVPHAGRDFPPETWAMVRAGETQLAPLQDRFADTLVDKAIEQGAPAIIARVPRLWIDLNRDEREIDPEMVDGPSVAAPLMSSKVRGGLGLIPRRLARVGDIWQTRLSVADVANRIETIHRPYHAAISRSLSALHARFGVAVLLDVHSMPPIRDYAGENVPRIVIGDRFGRSSSNQFTARALAELEASGFATAVNAPYAGGHILERHGRPLTGIHALQIEIDRTLYLDAGMNMPGCGLEVVQRLVAKLALALADEALRQPFAIAAE